MTCPSQYSVCTSWGNQGLLEFHNNQFAPPLITAMVAYSHQFVFTGRLLNISDLTSFSLAVASRCANYWLARCARRSRFLGSSRVSRRKFVDSLAGSHQIISGILAWSFAFDPIAVHLLWGWRRWHVETERVSFICLFIYSKREHDLHIETQSKQKQE